MAAKVGSPSIGEATNRTPGSTSGIGSQRAHRHRSCRTARASRPTGSPGRAQPRAVCCTDAHDCPRGRTARAAGTPRGPAAGPGDGERRPRAAGGAAPAGLPPAARHPADRPVRRRRVPGQPGRRRAVQPGAAAHPTDVAGGFAVLLLPYSLIGPFAGVLLDRWWRQRVLVWCQPDPRRCWSASSRSRSPPASRGVAVLRDRAAGHSRSAGSSCPRCRPRCRTWSSRERAGHRPTRCPTTSGAVVASVGGGVALAAAAGRRRRRRRVRADRAGVGASAYGSSAFLAPPASRRTSSARTTCSGRRRGRRSATVAARAGRRRPARGRAPRGRLRARRDRRCTGSATASRRSDAAAVPQLLHRPRRLPGRAGRAGPGRRRRSRSAAGWPPSITPAAVRRFGKPRWVTGLLAVGGVTSWRSGCPYTMPTLLLAALLLGFVAQGVKICVDTLVAGAGRRRLPRPGVLPLRHAVQRRVRGGGGADRARAAGDREVVPDARRGRRRVRATADWCALGLDRAAPGRRRRVHAARRAVRSSPVEPPTGHAAAACARPPAAQLGHRLVVRSGPRSIRSSLQVPPGLADQRARRRCRGAP